MCRALLTRNKYSNIRLVMSSLRYKQIRNPDTKFRQKVHRNLYFLQPVIVHLHQYPFQNLFHWHPPRSCPETFPFASIPGPMVNATRPGKSPVCYPRFGKPSFRPTDKARHILHIHFGHYYNNIFQ